VVAPEELEAGKEGERGQEWKEMVLLVSLLVEEGEEEEEEEEG